jgi:V8-like Glu-specific endopeptidase
LISHIRSRLSRAARRWFWAAPIVIVAVWLVMLHRVAPPPRPMDGAQPSVDNRARILNADDRTAVTDPTTLPWRTIGQIRAWWGAQGFTGTGVLVAPDQVLTAAHCVYRANLGGWAGDVTFTPARVGKTPPFGTARAIRYAVPRGYTQSQDEAHDVVLVTLDQPIGNETGLMEVAGATQDQYDPGGALLHSAGYPADKPGSMYAVSGSVVSGAGSDSVWQIDLDATFGQSGSPIWIDAPSDGRPIVVAVLVAELDNGRANLAAPVSADLLEQLRAGGNAGASIASAPGDAADVLVAEPGADSPLIASPIAACGAGIAPMMILSFAGLAALRSGHRRS